MSKQLDKLMSKAMETGKATINGRKREHDFGYSYVGDLEEQWAIELYGKDNSKLELRHWGTELITLTKYMNEWFLDINSFYCESKSDRDALMWLFNKFNVRYTVSYKPSLEEGWLINDKNEVVSKV